MSYWKFSDGHWKFSDDFIDRLFPQDGDPPNLNVMKIIFPGLLLEQEYVSIEKNFLSLMKHIMRNEYLKIPSQCIGGGKLSRVGRINKFTKDFYPLRRHEDPNKCLDEFGNVLFETDVDPVWFSVEPAMLYITPQYIGFDYGISCTRKLNDGTRKDNGQIHEINLLIEFKSYDNNNNNNSCKPLTTDLLKLIESVILIPILRSYTSSYIIKPNSNPIDSNSRNDNPKIDIPLAGYGCLPNFNPNVTDISFNEIFNTWNSNNGTRISSYSRDRIYAETFFKVIEGMEMYLNTYMHYLRYDGKVNLLGVSYPNILIPNSTCFPGELIISHKYLEDPLNKKIFSLDSDDNPAPEYWHMNNKVDNQNVINEIKKKLNGEPTIRHNFGNDNGNDVIKYIDKTLFKKQRELIRSNMLKNIGFNLIKNQFNLILNKGRSIIINIIDKKDNILLSTEYSNLSEYIEYIDIYKDYIDNYKDYTNLSNEKKKYIDEYIDGVDTLKHDIDNLRNVFDIQKIMKIQIGNGKIIKSKSIKNKKKMCGGLAPTKNEDDIFSDEPENFESDLNKLFFSVDDNDTSIITNKSNTTKNSVDDNDTLRITNKSNTTENIGGRKKKHNVSKMKHKNKDTNKKTIKNKKNNK